MLTKEGIRYLRLALGLTCDQLATKIYCTKQNISAVERNDKTTATTRLLLTHVLLDEFEKLPEGDETDFRCKCASKGMRYNTKKNQEFYNTFYR